MDKAKRPSEQMVDAFADALLGWQRGRRAFDYQYGFDKVFSAVNKASVEDTIASTPYNLLPQEVEVIWADQKSFAKAK